MSPYPARTRSSRRVGAQTRAGARGSAARARGEGCARNRARRTEARGFGAGIVRIRPSRRLDHLSLPLMTADSTRRDFPTSKGARSVPATIAEDASPWHWALGLGHWASHVLCSPSLPSSASEPKISSRRSDPGSIRRLGPLSMLELVRGTDTPRTVWPRGSQPHSSVWPGTRDRQDAGGGCHDQNRRECRRGRGRARGRRCIAAAIE